MANIASLTAQTCCNICVVHARWHASKKFLLACAAKNLLTMRTGLVVLLFHHCPMAQDIRISRNEDKRQPSAVFMLVLYYPREGCL